MGRAWMVVGLCCLASCGGGGGGPAGNGAVGILGAGTQAGSFSYYRDGSLSNPVSYLYAQDVDGDGLDEVFMVAFETQPNTPANYSATGVRVFGWKNGLFQDLSAQWLPQGQDQVGGVGDVAFGDFDGDGRTDVFLSAYTDMDHPVAAYALMNRGGVFQRLALGPQTWQHAVSAADVNGDGYTDVFVAGYSGFPQYMGSAAGLVSYQGMMGSSGLALGDLLGNGQVQVVFVDADGQSNGASGAKDTALYSIVLNNANQTVGFNLVAALPAPRLAAREDAQHSSHDIRARSVEFDGDGKLDVVVFSYFFLSAGQDAESAYRSEVQFLRNKGNGVFEDVTGAVRVGYDTSGYVGYVPVFRDFNGDGLLDLFSSQPDFFGSGRHKSTSLLMQRADKTFIDTAKSDFSAVIASGGGQAVMAKGPAGKWFLVKEGAWQRDSQTRVWIHPVLGL